MYYVKGSAAHWGSIFFISFKGENCFAADLLGVTSTGQETTSTSSSSSFSKTSEKDVYIIFIHALQNGLFRIHIHEYEKTQTK
jgi:hypothetical protein